MTPGVTPAVPEPVLEIVRRLEGAGFEAWCVGGALRDALVGASHADFDVATAAPPPEVRRLFPRTVPVGERHGTVGVLDRQGTLHEVTTFRRDVTTDGRHAVVAFGVSLDEDLARRDFTINALAWHPLRGEWRDPFGGAADLAAGVVRAVGDPVARFREDHLRILRALRFAARFGFIIEPATWEAARAGAASLAELSAERVRDEWFKGLDTAASVLGLVRLWREAGAAAVWLPELGDGAGLADAALSRAPRDPVLLTTVLTGDPVAVLRRLRASNAEVGRAASLVAGPPEPAGTDERAVRRWLAGLAAASDDALERYRLLHGASAPWAGSVERIRARNDPLTRGDLAVTGHDLAALGLSGPAIGEALGRLLDRVLDDPALNHRERLLAMLRDEPGGGA